MPEKMDEDELRDLERWERWRDTPPDLLPEIKASFAAHNLPPTRQGDEIKDEADFATPQ